MSEETIPMEPMVPTTEPEKKSCKKCKAGNSTALFTVGISLICGYFMVYGLFQTIKDIISLFTH
jgi:hypothetical protein